MKRRRQISLENQELRALARIQSGRSRPDRDRALPGPASVTGSPGPVSSAEASLPAITFMFGDRQRALLSGGR